MLVPETSREDSDDNEAVMLVLETSREDFAAREAIASEREAWSNGARVPETPPNAFHNSTATPLDGPDNLKPQNVATSPMGASDNSATDGNPREDVVTRLRFDHLPASMLNDSMAACLQSRLSSTQAREHAPLSIVASLSAPLPSLSQLGSNPPVESPLTGIVESVENK